MRFVMVAVAAMLILPATAPVKAIGTAYAGEAAPKTKTHAKMAKNPKKKKEKVEYLRAAPM